MGRKTFPEIFSYLTYFFFAFLFLSQTLKSNLYMCVWCGVGGWGVGERISSRKQFGIEGFLPHVKSGLRPQEWQLGGCRDGMGGISGRHVESAPRSVSMSSALAHAVSASCSLSPGYRVSLVCILFIKYQIQSKAAVTEFYKMRGLNNINLLSWFWRLRSSRSG